MLILIALAVVLGYGGLYAGKEIAAEGRRSWGGYAQRVRDTGRPADKVLVGFVSGLGWLAGTGARGIRRAVREDREMVRHWRSPQGRRERDEARAHREHRRREQRTDREQRKVQREGARAASLARQRAAALDRQRALGPDAPVACPHCAGRDANCEHCGGSGTVPQRTVDPFFGVIPGPDSPAPPAPANGSTPTPESPAAPAVGSTPTNGATTMPQATGEAQTFEQMHAQLALLQQDGNQIVADAHSIAQAAERLDAAAVAAKLDPATRGALSQISAACAEVAQSAAVIRPAAGAASNTLTQQQGPLHEAHTAQPNAANEDFLKA